MAAKITILSWDQAPTSRLERLVHAAAEKLTSPGLPFPRLLVWLERRCDDRAGEDVHIYVRLEAELFSQARLDGWRVRVESTGRTPEQAFKRTFKALEATSLAPGPRRAAAVRLNRLPTGSRPMVAPILAGVRRTSAVPVRP